MRAMQTESYDDIKKYPLPGYGLTPDLRQQAIPFFADYRRLQACIGRNNAPAPEEVQRWMKAALAILAAMAEGAELRLAPDLCDRLWVNQWIRLLAMGVRKGAPSDPEVNRLFEAVCTYPIPVIPIPKFEPRYRFTRDMFTSRLDELIPLAMPFAGRPNLNLLEVGSFEGMSTCWFIENVLTHPTSRITCIDIAFEGPFDCNVDQSGGGEKVTKLPGDSATLLRMLSPDSFDFIYIDGDHSCSAARTDAELAWPLLKRGGVIVFDDYGYDVALMGDDPRSGIDGFFATLPGEQKQPDGSLSPRTYSVELNGYQFAVRKL